MRTTIALWLCLAAFGAAARPAGADAMSTPPPAPALTGQMKDVAYLVGSWSCTVKLEAQSWMPAQTVSAANTFSIGPGNVLAFSNGGSGYLAYGFLGYSESAKKWWSNSVDNMGDASAETGTETGGVSTMVGTSAGPEGPATIRDIITKASDTSYSDVFQRQVSGKWQPAGRADCVKS